MLSLLKQAAHAGVFALTQGRLALSDTVLKLSERHGSATSVGKSWRLASTRPRSECTAHTSGLHFPILLIHLQGYRFVCMTMNITSLCTHDVHACLRAADRFSPGACQTKLDKLREACANGTLALHCVGALSAEQLRFISKALQAESLIVPSKRRDASVLEQVQ